MKKPSETTIASTEAIADLLLSTLYPFQRDIDEKIESTDGSFFVINAHRGFGKSRYCCTKAAAAAYRKPGTHVKLISPTQKLTRAIVRPIFADLFASVEQSLRPSFKAMDGLYEFPNGSTILTSGSDLGRADALRGTTTHLVIYDEGAFSSDLKYLHYNVILPRLLPVNGRAIFISTPPLSPSHPYVEFVERAREENGLFTYTINDNPTITPELRARYAKECGGEDSTSFRREFMCEFVTEEKYAAFPALIRKPELLGDHEITGQTKRYFGVSVDFSGNTVVLRCDVGSGGVRVGVPYIFSQSDPQQLANFLRPQVTPDTVLLGVCPEDVCAAIARQSQLFLIPFEFDVCQVGIPAVRNALEAGKLSFVSKETNAVAEDLANSIFEENFTQLAEDARGGRFDSVLALSAVVLHTAHIHGVGEGFSSLQTRDRLERAFRGAAYKGVRKNRFLLG